MTGFEALSMTDSSIARKPSADAGGYPEELFNQKIKNRVVIEM